MKTTTHKATPDVQPTEPQKALTSPRVSTALLANTIQKVRSDQLNILDDLKGDQASRRQLTIANLDEVGANLTAIGWRALIGITRLATARGHYAEVDEQRKTKQLVAPRDIIVTQTEFFEAMGMKRIVDKRNFQDFPGSEKRDALQGLAELSKPVLQVYSTAAASGKANRKDVIRTVAPLITTKELYLDVTTKREREIIEGDISGKGLKHLRITPSDIFYLSSFMNLPDTLYQRLEELEGKRALTPSLYKNVIVLALHVHQHPENKTLRRQLDKYLANTGKNKMLESRQRNRAVKDTSKELDKLKKAGAVTEHRIVSDRGSKYIEVDVVPEAFE